MKKKDIEEYYFKNFCAHFGLLASEFNSSDRPDFISNKEGSKGPALGIELTRFYRESGSSISSEQIQSKRRKEVLERSEAEYSARSRGLRLSLGFNSKCPIRDVNAVVAKIVSLSSQIQLDESGSLLRERFADILELDFVYVQWNLEAPWQLTQVHSGQLISQDQLQEIVREKDRQAGLGPIWWTVYLSHG